MTTEQKQQEVAEEKKQVSLHNLVSAAFCKSVTVNIRGVKLTLEQPKKQDVLNIQLDTFTKMGDAREFITNPKKMESLSKEEKDDILDQAQDITDAQTVKVIRLCCTKVEIPNGDGEYEVVSLDELSDDDIKTVVFQTGNDASPLSIAAKKLSGLYDNDLIQDDPFFRRAAVQSIPK